jgi:hypothetical protein
MSIRKKEEAMNVTNVVFDIESFGITQTSLKMLRNAIAEKLTHRIAVFEIPTNDLCCGYLIFDWEWQDATWTGDGFRMDGSGEGGAGYRSAEALFEFFGIRPIRWEAVNMDEVYSLPGEDIEKFLLGLAQKIAQDLTVWDFVRPIDRKPPYLRCL